MMPTSHTPQQSRGRRMLLLMVFLFSLPVIVVLLMYRIQWQPGGASHGELIRPPAALNLETLQDAHGQPFTPGHWKDKWHLVYVSRAGCTEDCRSQIHWMRQIHISLNKEMERVQRVLVVPGGLPASELAALTRDYPRLVILAGSGAAPLAAQLLPDDSPAAGGMFLVDPLGNLMMRYPQGYDPKGLQRDLGRLLRYSWVG